MTFYQLLDIFIPQHPDEFTIDRFPALFHTPSPQRSLSTLSVNRPLFFLIRQSKSSTSSPSLPPQPPDHKSLAAINFSSMYLPRHFSLYSNTSNNEEANTRPGTGSTPQQNPVNTSPIRGASDLPNLSNMRGRSRSITSSVINHPTNEYSEAQKMQIKNGYTFK
jgi:hypothetical protein